MSTIQERAKDKENPYNTFGKDNFMNANTGQEVRMSSENWDSAFANGGIALNPEIDQNSIWNKYIKNLPDQVILQDLLIDMFGGNEILIKKYYKKHYIIPATRLACFPTETLEFLVKKYNSNESTM